MATCEKDRAHKNTCYVSRYRCTCNRLSSTKHSKEVIVQVSAYSARELRLTLALHNDPDLGRLNSTDIQKLLQSIFVCTGCDYIKFFSKIGKAKFMRYFYQYAAFITGEIDYAPGSLSDVNLADNKWKTGFLAFLRLIGTVFKNNHQALTYSLPILLFFQIQQRKFNRGTTLQMD